jgi:hypothetical protein
MNCRMASLSPLHALRATAVSDDFAFTVLPRLSPWAPTAPIQERLEHRGVFLDPRGLFRRQSRPPEVNVARE